MHGAGARRMHEMAGRHAVCYFLVGHAELAKSLAFRRG
jgi:hypothetical protein